MDIIKENFKVEPFSADRTEGASQKQRYASATIHPQAKERRFFCFVGRGLKIMVLLTVIFLFAYVYNMKESWFNKLESLVGGELSEAFNKKISIDKIKGGIFRDIVLVNVKVSNLSGGPILEFGEVTVNYRLWDFFKKDSNRQQMRNLILNNGWITSGIIPLKINGCIVDIYDRQAMDLVLKIEDPSLSGSIRLKENLLNPSIEGFLNLSDKSKINVLGNISIRNGGNIEVKNLSIVKVDGENPDNISRVDLRGSFLKGTKANPPAFLLSAQLNPFMLGQVDFISNVEITGKVIKGKNDIFDSIKGEIKTSNSMLNNNPFKGLKTAYVLTSSVLEISSFKLGKSLDVTGSIELAKPHMIDLTVNIYEADFEDLVLLITEGTVENINSGFMDGQLRINGPLATPEVKGWIKVKGVDVMGDVGYRLAAINLETEGSIVKIRDSKILQEEGGLLTLDGFVDLRLIGDSEFLADIKIKSGQKTVDLDGWRMTQETQEPSKFGLKKDVGEDFSVSFNKKLTDEFPSRTLKGEEEEVGLEYKIKNNKSLKMKLKENDGFLGVEHKVKF